VTEERRPRGCTTPGAGSDQLAGLLLLLGGLSGLPAAASELPLLRAQATEVPLLSAVGGQLGLVLVGSLTLPDGVTTDEPLLNDGTQGMDLQSE